MVNDFATDRSPGGAPAPRILVLGGNGRLGRLLSRAWAARDFEGGAFGYPALLPTWQMRRVEDGAADASATVFFDPLTEPRMLADAIAGSDAVLNLAGPTGADADHDDHAALARAILAARPAARAVPVLLLSSAAVYGREAGPLDETGPCRPESAYGVGKLAMEAAARDAGARIHVLRLGNVAGADALLGRASPGCRVVLDRFEDGGTPVRAYVGPIALARILAALLSRAVAGAPLPAVLNVAAGQVSMADLLDAAAIGWTARGASTAAIREVRLSTRRLDALVPLPQSAHGAVGMVAEWRSLAPAPAAMDGASR